jgi:kumamolisin
MRGVPDVCGDADPQSGYEVRVDGSGTIIGGTSAVAPLWAGLIARINAAKASPVGFINPALYSLPGALRDITQGNTAASRLPPDGTPAPASAARTVRKSPTRSDQPGPADDFPL